MSKAIYVRFEVPKDLTDKTYQVVEVAKESGKIRKGTNEGTEHGRRGGAARGGGGAGASSGWGRRPGSPRRSPPTARSCGRRGACPTRTCRRGGGGVGARIS